MTALDGARARAAAVPHDDGPGAVCGGDRMPRTALDLLAAHPCDYPPCPHPAQVVLTHPRTGQYLLLVCAACAPRYQAMLRRLAARPGMAGPREAMRTRG